MSNSFKSVISSDSFYYKTLLTGFVIVFLYFFNPPSKSLSLSLTLMCLPDNASALPEAKTMNMFTQFSRGVSAPSSITSLNLFCKTKRFQIF